MCACPFHAASVLVAATCSSFLLLREVCEGLPRRKTAERYYGVGANVGDGEGEVRECECCGFEGLETVEEFFWGGEEEGYWLLGFCDCCRY